MASRVQGFRRGKVEDEPERVDPEVAAQVHKPVYVDKAILNEAVETTLEGADPRHADTMRKLWAMDQDSDPAHAYFADQVRRRVQSKYTEVTRKEHVVNEVLNQAEAAKVAEYAREYNIVFRNVVTNEHALFSARRGIDHQILLGKFPSHMKFLDFGGSVQYHVRRGNTNATVISPFDMDIKDATRQTLTKLALRKISVDHDLSHESREMARSVLAQENKYHRPETVQTTTAKAMFSLAVHVYDVPLTDWPYMMERCGVRVHEGCVHFINDFFESDEGEFEFSGARYEIDRQKDVFRMRVGKSSASWYTHRWSDFMRYGANQILSTESGRYSYQIVERRQDTIFYRILRVDSVALAEREQYYALPTVPVAEVDGFEVFTSSSISAKRRTMQRKQYLFPQVLWERMLTYASAELDRGGLSYPKMFNYYRTVVPRQTINSVLVSGGQSVPIWDVPALIVMAGTVAYGNAILLQRTIRARTDEIEMNRALADESTIFKGFRVFIDALVAAGTIPLSPFPSVTGKMGKVYMSLVRQKLVTWQPRVKLRMFNAALFVDHKQLSYTVSMPDQLNYAAMVDDDQIGRLVDLSSADPNVARDLLTVCGDALSSDVQERLKSTVGTETLVDDEASHADALEKPGVSTYMRDDVRIRKFVYPPVDTAELVRLRRLSVQEALVECNTESDAIAATCARIIREVLVAGKPNEVAMRKYAEELFNPDLWRVSNGVLVDSVLNPNSQNFTYSGVYVPVSGSSAHSGLHPVSESYFDGTASHDGKEVHRCHYVLPFEYTGYVLVMDGLKIFNGPAVAETLSRVLDMDDEQFKFKIVCHQGPPGCGKTTTVARQGDPNTDVFLAPTRIASAGLSEKLVSNFSLSKQQVRNISRTLDSLLVNYSRLPDRAKTGFTRMKIDEYVLARAGKWIAAAVLLGVQELHAYGDDNQIKAVPRVDVPTFYTKLIPQVLEEEFVTYRNAAKIVAAYNYVYGNEVRTKSTEEGSVVRVKSMNEVQWMKDCRLLSMYQADKRYLTGIAEARGIDKPVVSTTHEAQGSDCDQVVLYNGEFRKRGPEDTFYLYGKTDYSLVALSRARVSVVYVKMSDEPDIITEMIEKANDVRRIQAAREIKTQGSDNLKDFS